MGITITVKGKDDPANTLDLFDDIVKEVKFDLTLIQDKLRLLGYDCADQMVAIIIQNKKRPQNGEDLDLENHIGIVYNNENGWGVGDIDELNSDAPYWAAVNWGSNHMVGRRVPGGSFSPINEKPELDFFRQDRWVTGGRFSFIVKNEIPAMNYIEKTIFWLEQKIDEIIATAK